ncbi:MAG: DEAD/DEAH box helicase [Pseudomonadota bacterium]
MTTFADFGLFKTVLKAVTEEGYETPTPIQAQAIPHLLDDRDLLGIAQTGTGKTAAFALPTLDFLTRDFQRRKPNSCRVLVLAPTRELAAQITENFRTYSRFTDAVTQCVFGGVKIGRQIRDLNKGCHILVATPGRLLDLIEQKAVSLGDVEVLILDEADQMLDMGFIRDIRKILAKVPDDRQTLLFSATMPKAIGDLAQEYLNDPVRVSVAPESTTAERVNQGVLHVNNSNKLRVLEALLRDPDIDRALVFTRTKHGADKVVRKLLAKGITASAIHGNKSQSQRLKALAAFKEGNVRVLIATDIAARGIDISGISHVINFEMPNVAEQYVHRIGRTARAGRSGLAVSLVAEDELYFLREVEKITRTHVDVLETPEGCEGLILPTPDRSVRVRKPKGPDRSAKARGKQAAAARKKQRPQQKRRRSRKPKKAAANA